MLSSGGKQKRAVSFHMGASAASSVKKGHEVVMRRERIPMADREWAAAESEPPAQVTPEGTQNGPLLSAATRTGNGAMVGRASLRFRCTGTLTGSGVATPTVTPPD